MIQKILKFLGLKKAQKHTKTLDINIRKPNPYTLVYWRSNWSKNKTLRNNTRYWEFEVKHNGLKLP